MGRVLRPAPGEGQIRIKVRAAGISPDRSGRRPDLQSHPAAPGRRARLRGSRHRRRGRARCHGHVGLHAVTALCSAWRLRRVRGCVHRDSKPESVSWLDAAALPSSAEAAVGVLRQLAKSRAARHCCCSAAADRSASSPRSSRSPGGVKVISAVGEHDETLARELGATPVRYRPGVAGRVRALGAVDACRRAGQVSWPAAAAAGPSGTSPCPIRPPLTSALRSPNPRPTVLLVP